MSNNQLAIEKLNRISLHYTGSEDWDALFETQEWKQVYENNLSTANGDEDKARAWTIQALGLEKLSGQTVKGHLMGARKFTSKGKNYEITSVLLSNEEKFDVWDEYFEGDVFTPVEVSGVRIDNNIGLGKTRTWSKKGDSVSVTASEHSDPLPQIGIEPALTEARKPNRKNKAIRNNTARGHYFVGTTLIDDDHGVFVNDEESSRPGVGYTVVDVNGIKVKDLMSLELFQERFGFDANDDYDNTRTALEGQLGHYIADVDVLANLPDEIAERYSDEILEAWHKHTKRDKNDKVVTTQRFRIGAPEDQEGEGYWVERIYESGEGNVVAQVDVEELGYLPEASFGPQEKEKRDGGTWIAQEGTDVWFPNVEPGERPVSQEAAEMADLLKSQRKIDVEG